MSEFTGDKKHTATPLHRKRAREQGRYARSRDLSAALVLLSAMTILWMSGPRLMALVRTSLTNCLSVDGLPHMEHRDIIAHIQMVVAQSLWALLPLMLGVVAVAVLYQWMQSGFRWWPGKLQLDADRINPLRGAGRMLELPTWIDLAFGMLKVLVALVVVPFGVYRSWQTICESTTGTVGDVAHALGTSLLSIGWQVAGVLLCLGGVEYAVQCWRHEQELKMTDEELREELKSVMGDPQLAARRQAHRRKLLRPAGDVESARTI